MEEEKKVPKPRGGKREGAGRKPKSASGKTLRVGFRCSQAVWDILQQVDGDKTAFIEKAIKEKWRRAHY